eukprot:6020406-Pyramimonas_sp.AAC.2
MSFVGLCAVRQPERGALLANDVLLLANDNGMMYIGGSQGAALKFHHWNFTALVISSGEIYSNGAGSNAQMTDDFLVE